LFDDGKAVADCFGEEPQWKLADLSGRRSILERVSEPMRSADPRPLRRCGHLAKGLPRILALTLFSHLTRHLGGLRF
jgi:hypothetical protein